MTSYSASSLIDSTNEFPEAVIFDMDGLLLDTEKLSAQSFAAVCAEWELPAMPQLLEALTGLAPAAQHGVMAGHLPDSIVVEDFDAAWKAAFLGLLEEGVPLKPAAAALAGGLAKMGMPLGVATSTPQAKAERMLIEAGLHPWLKVIIGGDRIRCGKPAPDIYLAVAAALGKAPGGCLALEDSENGVRAAHAAGMTVIQIPDLQTPSAALLELGHPVLPDLASVAHRYGWAEACGLA